MYLLGPIYNVVKANYGTKLNHFGLVRLAFYSLDKTLIYFLIFLILRLLYLKLKRNHIHWGHEVLIWIFTFYLFLLLALTVFRGIYFPWQIQIHWNRSVNVINFKPLAETLKMQYAKSLLDFVYNLYGNIVWFIPFGLLWPYIGRHLPGLIRTTLTGMLLSVFIEMVQFFLATGITDIDDVIFNTAGTLIGYLLYWLFFKRWHLRHALNK